MEEKIVIRTALAARNMTQGDLANRLGIPAQSLSRTLGVSVVNTQSHWPAILDALGLEVVIRPKGEQ
jgi:transcriptional regulator with XRE-family HTH domain